jgi:hypothetical protein
MCVRCAAAGCRDHGRSAGQQRFHGTLGLSHVCVHAVLLPAAETMEGVLDKSDSMEV